MEWQKYTMNQKFTYFYGNAVWSILGKWFDSSATRMPASELDAQCIDWMRAIPFILLHLSCFAVIWTGWSPVAVVTAIALYALRMFAITGFYHRYFSHRAFKTSRSTQLIFAILGASAVQRGPLWWAAHHRQHHAHADQGTDPHSPGQHGFWWSHMAWFLTKGNFHTQGERIRDLSRYPELRFLDRYDVLVPLLLAMVLFAVGESLAWLAPDLGTNGLQMLTWGFAISTVALYHVTFTINSMAHTIGSRRYPTKDDSRNNLLLAILTFGEGWHNNHHHYPGSARQGFFWWEIDITYYVLALLERIGLIWDLRPVPEKIKRLGETS
jgi:stearoyl-CoA desaturase (delta-9 desaturase)